MDNMQMQPVTFQRDGDVAIIALNRPESANAIDLGLASMLRDIANQVADEGWARAVLLRANGRMFSAGGDVTGMIRERAAADPDGYAAFFTALVGGLHDAIRALNRIGAPMIAAVNGSAAGGGMSLALACDLVVATARTKFVPAYPSIGLSVDGGMSWSLSRAVGQRKALQLLLENRPVSAQEAERLGIVSCILDEDGFEEAALAKARELSVLPRQAVGKIRQLIRNSSQASLDEQLSQEIRAISALCTANDAAEGLQAFAERRKPVFSD
jgi:2-(1,2-epoxy-1,2-dihydrophenyl)acetyl-CoA isomerase